MKITNYPVLLGALAFSTTLSATEQSTIEEQILVTGTRTEQLLSDSLFSASVLNQEDIEAAQPMDVVDLLRRLPGVDFDRNGSRGATSSVRLRGAESDQVLVLVDGVRISSASNGQAAFQHIPVEHIERIEVVRGPLSGLYGSEAIAGVIQIFTKSGENAEQPLTGTVQLGHRSFETFDTSASLRGRTGETYYSANVSYEDSDGFDSTLNEVGVDADDDAYDELGLSASIGHTFENQINLEARYVRSEGSSEFDSGGADVTDFLNDVAGLRVSAPIGEQFKVTLDYGYSRDERETFGTNPSVFNTERDSALMQLHYQLADNQEVILGYEYYDDKVESTANFVASSRHNKAVFGQYLAEFGAVSVQGSIRNDDNEAYGSETTGTAALGFAILDNATVSISYGTAFKAPSFNDLFFPFTDFGFGFTYVGNPDLRPESSESFEVLIKQRTNDALSWSLAFYRTDIEDLVQGTADFSSVENIAEAELSGVEGTLDWSMGAVNAALVLGYVDAEDASTGERLDRRSRFKAGLDLATCVGAFDASASLSYNGDRVDGGTRLGGYALLDVRGTYQLAQDVTVGTSIENVLDRDYTLISRFGTTFRNAERTYSAFVSYSF